jgi:protein SCO1/2
MTKLLRALVALTAALVLAGCASSHADPAPKASGLNDQISSSGKYAGFQLTPPYPRPSFTLTDASGKPFPFATATAGHPTLLFFGYTSCPDICPATMADIGQAVKRSAVALQRDTYVVFVSTDVRHDTGPVIARWLRNFDAGTHAHFVGLRGTQSQIDAAQAAAHTMLAEDGGQTHSTQVLLYGSDDYARDSFIYNNNGEQQQIEHDLPLVAG